jgi:hypothetical protein
MEVEGGKLVEERVPGLGCVVFEAGQSAVAGEAGRSDQGAQELGPVGKSAWCVEVGGPGEELVQGFEPGWGQR